MEDLSFRECGLSVKHVMRLNTKTGLECATAQRGPEWSALSFAVKLAVAGVGKSSKDDASTSIDHLTNVHSQRENKDEKEQIDAQQRMQQSTEAFRREHVVVHPDEDDYGENAEHDDNDSGVAFGSVCGGEGLLDESEFGVCIFRVGFGAHAGFLSIVRCLRRVATP